MRPLIRAPKDFGSGLLFLAIGATAVGMALRYPLGTASRMGPGYFPTVLGALLAAIGLACMIRSLAREGEPIVDIAWQPLACVTLAIAVFGALVRGAGLVPALVLLVLISAWASRRFAWPAALSLAVGLAAFAVLIFGVALGLPLPVLGPWFGG